MAIRVSILEDDKNVRLGLRSLLEHEDDIEVISESSGVEHALETISKSKPDVALIDVRLPDGSGIEVARSLRQSMPEVACIILTCLSDEKAYLAACLASASGYSVKQIRSHDLVGKVRAAKSSHVDCDTATLRVALREIFNADSSEGTQPALGEFEERLISEVARGRSNRDIAEKLDVSEQIVNSAIGSILSLLDLGGVEASSKSSGQAALVNQ